MTYGIIGIFAGYTIASYAVVLVKGYDIPFKAWVNPIHPWQWPSGGVPKAKPTQILPH